MKQALAVTAIGIAVMSLLCACTIRSDKEVSSEDAPAPEHPDNVVGSQLVNCS